MSKTDNLELAKKIIDQHATVIKVERFDTIVKPTEDDPANTEIKKSKKQAHGVEVAIIGYTMTTIDGTADEAKQAIAKQLAADLDSGALTLSDTWAEDNLQ